MVFGAEFGLVLGQDAGRKPTGFPLGSQSVAKGGGKFVSSLVPKMVAGRAVLSSRHPFVA